MRHHVQRQRVLRLAEACEEAILQHRLCAASGFLRGLANEHQRAFPIRLHVDERTRGSDPRGHVHIVTAAMSDECFLALVLRLHLAGERKAGLFFHRQRIELGADHDHRSGAVLENADNTGLADAFGDFEADVAQLFGELFGGIDLFERELRMRMDVLVKGLYVRIVAGHLGVDILAIAAGDIR